MKGTSSMISWTRQSFFNLLMSWLVLTFIVSSAWAGSNFIRVPLGKGASIEVPKNWVVLSGSQRTTIEAFIEAKGYRLSEATLSFSANLYDDRGKVIAKVNARFYPDNTLTQAEVQQITAADLKEIDVGLRKLFETTMKAEGVRMLNWYGTKMQVINGLYIIVHEHQYSAVGDAGVTRRYRGLRVSRYPRSFTVTISYREIDATMLLPIVDYMTKSLRQE